MAGLDLATLLIGAVIGAASTLCLQFFNWLLQHYRGRRFLSISLGLLNRHIIASQKSLSQTTADMPLYLQVARVRFCKVSTALMPEDLSRLGILTRTNERARILLTAVRNSDIVLDEIAARLDPMSHEALVRALADARENMAILGRFIAGLGLGTVTSRMDPEAEVAGKAISP